ncbi:MBL fold metallo-hydrolase [Halomonas heilongjiangensis]|uniref:MBL fold metallo-hydrolase n=1 Tax=Halomonas heilongjiangensis TaxID=1387883 RepID=A0A2N7TVH3_9GAMM|nr:MBL fold metallo-hydrolase [Halomonas heilongjiangensis]PMR72158.1 MBL fold metallo-hydrolase [Halomonas heilongjiangensis]PXX91409.1 MBL fold metallo-hydrolase [Halomonas heilongjiangensis]
MKKLLSPVRWFTLATAALGLASANADAQTDETTAAPLTLQVYNADAGSFHVNAVLVSGENDAVLLDTGFTRADALRIAAMVLDSGKELKTIYISQADPDYYFGIDVLEQFFPDAEVVATEPTVKKIEDTLPTKLEIWGPRLGANAPQQVPLPEVLSGDTIPLEGQTLEIRGLDDSLPHRSYVWIPSIGAVAGGVNVYAGLHAWTADAQTAAERAAWVEKLDDIAALNPTTVVPGHSLPELPQDASQLAYTQDYLQRFETELTHADDSAALIEAMQDAYPQAGLGIALEIGAKVNTGEMEW